MSDAKTSKYRISDLKWHRIRKFESLVFLFMFFAVPLFALRVVEYTQVQLLVAAAAHDLVSDLHRCKNLSSQLKQTVTVQAAESTPSLLAGKRLAILIPNGFKYVIKVAGQIKEEMTLAEGMRLGGLVTFMPPAGVPEKPSSFILSSDYKTTTIEIDARGDISVP
ncbi:MAG: hypothetical protein KIT34_09610 [Cyanobacteria bacterium TGS_CYA1]|nr:hypothetical protein [Cyanobacteria bacterium TGS_CYA1]